MDLTNVITPELNDLRNGFVARGFDLRGVGGMVRDLMRGEKPKDKDFCTDATPDEQIAIYKEMGVAYYETGLQHGTITVKLEDGDVYEITSLRTETDHDGRHATVSYTRDWLADLGRRDLTFNAMAVTFDGEVIDPFNGAEDLKNGIVRFVGSPDERMEEDYLRILRWLRFQGRIAPGQPFDDETVGAAKRQAEGLAGISRERVWMEVAKIISGNDAATMIQAMHDIGIAEHIGLPDGHMPSFKTAYFYTKNPVSLLARYLVGDQSIADLAAAWKWSAEERDLGIFLQARKHGPRLPSDNIRDLKRMVAHDGIPMDWAIELAHINGADGIEADVMAKWNVPVFPVKGQDLIDAGMKPGKEMGAALKIMKATWADSDYVLTKVELMN